MKYLIVFLIFSINCVGQIDLNSSSAAKISYVSSELEAKKLAEEDIKNNFIVVFIQGGFAPVVYTTDKIFEKKFNVNFWIQGCVIDKLSITYNFVIFDYLYKTYGKKWVKEIRKDALGFKEWKKQKNNKQTTKIE